jgi:hypothetical protein
MTQLNKIVPSRKTCQKMQDMGIDFGETADYIGDDGASSFIHDKLPAEALSKLCMWCKEEGYL